MAGLAAVGALTPPLLIGFAFAMGIGSALDEPLWQAITAEVVPRSSLPGAVTLGGVSMNLARSLGPAVGGAVVALAFGPSGVGKSALVHRTREDLKESMPGLVFLAGRCYAQESVPYKAIDGLIDPLSRYLQRLSPAEAVEIIRNRAMQQFGLTYGPRAKPRWWMGES